jgi:cobalamin-dependent methionine synthase I
MSGSVEKITNIKVDFEEKRILKLIGYRKRSAEIKEPIKSIIAEERKKLDSLLHPASIYTIIDYAETNKHPIFKDAEKVAICICTIGPELEQETKKLMGKNEMTRALILDALGSEAAEEVAIQSDRILAEKARKMNLWPSKRFSPGYGKWDIKEQRFVFRLLPAADIGVRLTESCMMIPRKSITFRINFYREQKLSTRKKGL